MAFEAKDVYPNKSVKVDDQRTFALVYPFALKHRVVGRIVNEFEKRNLKVEDIRFMGVKKKFAAQHLSKKGRTPFLVSHPNFDWVFGLSCGPVVVMVLRGDDAINKGCEVLSNERKVTVLDERTINFYCSGSVESAEEDIDMWFDRESGNLSEKDFCFVFADGTVKGAKEIFEGSVKHLRPYGIDLDPKEDNIFWKEHVFVLISSIAIRNYKVGGIIYGLEKNGVSIRGMKFVKKVDFSHSKVWDEIGENEFGIVVFLDMVDRHNIQELDEVDGLVNVDLSSRWSYCIEIKRNLIYLSDKGAPAWQLAEEFFPYGAVSWMERIDGTDELFGGYFDATLIALVE